MGWPRAVHDPNDSLFVWTGLRGLVAGLSGENFRRGGEFWCHVMRFVGLGSSSSHIRLVAPAGYWLLAAYRQYELRNVHLLHSCSPSLTSSLLSLRRLLQLNSLCR
ncbi:unnamed protein product, partial [Phaeothamnion confervicola]